VEAFTVALARYSAALNVSAVDAVCAGTPVPLNACTALSKSTLNDVHIA